MTIDSIKDLQKVIALCRKTGVVSIKVDGIELQLGAAPIKTKVQQAIDYSADFPESSIPVPQFQGYSAPTEGETTVTHVQAVADKIASDELTDEQLLFYSAQGHVEQ